MVRTCHKSAATLSEIAREEVASWQLGLELDLYDRMKELAWKMLLAVFVDLQPADPNYQNMKSNALLFAGSIAVKAVASLLTASLLNLHLFPSEPSLVPRVRSLASEPRGTLLDSILFEPERLSPPVIGVMRRVQNNIVLHKVGDPGTLIPEGWDAWLYFVGANRSEAAYSEAHKFVPAGFVGGGALPSLAFGFGDKTCLSRDIVRRIIWTVASVIADSGFGLRGPCGL
ncbi:hypothetical protein N7505_007662 [Penicillium chrysogenum]|uniref:Cytochrome P450 n=1 Tax=Penicillium chrysogenum TaxID=5076 RepID=A0ABQ8WEZ8_PENCH|nr:hypothetical protein N7505_007662 [Penicillium chrysogenum]